MPHDQAGDRVSQSLIAEILRIFESPETAVEAEFRELIERHAGPIYGTSPDHPGKIVEMRSDGSQIAGTLQGRRFIPDPVP